MSDWPDPGDPTIPDRTGEGLAIRSMILGNIVGLLSAADSPVLVREVEEWFDSDDIIQHVSVVTKSGLKYKIKVEYEGEEPR